MSERTSDPLHVDGSGDTASSEPSPLAAAGLRTLIASLPGIVTVQRADGTWEWVASGRGFGAGHGVDTSGSEGVFGVMHHEDLEFARGAYDEFCTGARRADDPIVVRLHAATGTVRWYELSVSDCRGVDGIDGVVVHARDVDDLQRAAAAMRASTARLTALLANIDGGVLVIDDSQYVVFANDEFARLFGLGPTAHSLVGRPVSAITASMRSIVADPYAFDARDAAVYDDGERIRGEFVELVDGRVLERSYNPVVVGAVSYGHMWIYHDVTERLAAEADLAAARDAALEAVQLKAEFVATVSHELRTPLHGVIGLVELLHDDVDGSARATVERIQGSLRSLHAIVDDILDFEKIEAGRLVVEHIPFDLVAAVRDAVAVFEPIAADKGVSLTVAVGPTVPAVALGDPLRLGQIVKNLVSNAVKFTEVGGVEVDVACDAVHRVHIVVRDSGSGISADALERIFEPFSQADQSTVRRFGGTGLGLSISRRLAALMGGTLVAESTPSVGSTFSVVLPVVDVISDATTTAPHHSASPSSSGAAHVVGRVLVAEDDDTSRLLVERQLQRLGFDADCVADGRRAVEVFEAAARGTYCAVFVDGQMPGLDGPATVAEIRAVESARGDHGPVRIIALTANAHVADRERFARAGADDFCVDRKSVV